MLRRVSFEIPWLAYLEMNLVILEGIESALEMILLLGSKQVSESEELLSELLVLSELSSLLLNSRRGRLPLGEE